MKPQPLLVALAVGLVTLSVFFTWKTDNAKVAAQESSLTSTFQVNSYVDDVNEVDTTYEEFLPTAWIGNSGSPTASYLGLRFTNISIPQGSTIVSAHFEMYSTQSQWLTLGYEIAGDASGNSLGFSTSARPSQRTLTAQKVSHSSNEQWMTDTWYPSNEINSIIQEIVNRSDWHSGNNLSLIMRGTTGTWARKIFRTFDGAPLLAPKLVITYEPSSQTEPTATPTSIPQTTGFQNSAVIIGLPSPTTLVFTPDGRMLIGERDGRIRVVQPGAIQFDPLPFLELTNIESIVGERSLIGIALDPNFATNNYYYVFYTAQTPLRDRVSRFTASGNTTALSTEVVIWEDDKVSSDIHHGGGLLFGPDGKLYISTGDGHDTKPVSTHDAQTLTNFKGKVLRINSDGTVPTDNPFYDGTGPNYDAIWARGFRNPYRMSYDSQSGQIHIYDVGGGSNEEINVGAAGANFGWPLCEGVCQTAGLTNPLFAYSHQGRDAAIGGGTVYRGNQFPPEYNGNIFYGDFVQGWIRRLTFQANGVVDQDLAFDPPTGSTARVGDTIDFELGPDGSLYYVDIGGGAIRKIRYYSGNQPPVIASIVASPISGPGPTLNVTFDSTVSDPENNPLTYQWEFGDGTTSSEADPTHIYAQPGSFTARLIVSDGTNQTFSTQIAITVGTPPDATINEPTEGTIFEAGDEISFSATATDPDETLPDSAYSWTIVFHHDTHVHPAYGPIIGVSGVFTIPTDGHDFSGDTWYEIILTVTDSQNTQSKKSVGIYPHKVNLTVQSDPPGIPLSLDETTQSTPLLKDTLAQFEHTLTAPVQYLLAGKTYQFISWSDGGAATHKIIVPVSDETYTATYQELTDTATANITGTVFVDVNRNALKDSGEVGVADAMVSLRGTVLNTSTNVQGNYAFPNQPVGDYTVELALPTDYRATTPLSVNLSTSDGQDAIVNFGIAVGETENTPPDVTINEPTEGTIFEAGDAISFSGIATDPDETLPDSAYSWTIVFHRDSVDETVYGPTSGVKSGVFTIPTNGHDFSGETWYEIILTVTDSQNTQSSQSVNIYPHKVDLLIQSNPPGIPLSLDETTQSTPLLKDTLAQFEHTLTAPVQYLLAGKTYQFISWSDGGAATHNIIVPASDETYIATYQELTDTTPGTISNTVNGTVFVDVNRNAVLNGGEAGFSGATVSLTGSAVNAPTITTTTDMQGNYAFANQPVGDYAVSIALPAGYEATSPLSVPLSISAEQGAIVNFGIAVGETENTPPDVTINEPTEGAIFEAGDEISFSGIATDPDETLPDSAYSWTIVFHRDSVDETVYGPTSGVKSGVFTIPTDGHDFSGDTWYEIILTVTDSQNTQSKKSVGIYPHKVDLLIQSNPPGIPLSLDETTQSTPLLKDTLAQFEHTLTAPVQYLLAGKTYQFISWSDGGAATHKIIVPVSDETYTATYQELTDTATANITGTVFVDVNRNALKDSGEVGVADAMVSLRGTVLNTSTNVQGNYAFPNQPVGDYTVELALPTDYRATTPLSVNLSTSDGQDAIVNFGIVAVIPTTQTFPIAASGDDVNEMNDGNDTNKVNSTLESTSGVLWFGNNSATTGDFAGLRFTEVTIPQGVTITSAHIEVYSTQDQWISLSYILSADNSGNSVAFSPSNKPSQRELTTQQVTHTSYLQWDANTWYPLDDITAIIQAIVNRADWQSGNSISILLEGNGVQLARKFVQSVDGASSNAPRLVVTINMDTVPTDDEQQIYLPMLDQQ